MVAVRTDSPLLLAEALIAEIRAISASFSKVVVALSGGVDSTVALFLSLLALGKEKITACTVDWGEYFPEKARRQVLFLRDYFDVSHCFLPGKAILEDIVKGGPSCNLCTKKAKLGTIRNYFGNSVLIVGGANQSDSWGKRGMKFLCNTYSPLFDLEKEKIQELASFFHLPVQRVGENRLREGCLVKHLLKPLASSYHAQAVIKSNEILWKNLDEVGFERDIANVKIVGPLGKNQALVNVWPLPSQSLREKIENALGELPEVDEITWIDEPVTLVVRTNPGQYHNAETLFWLKKGRLQPDFAFPIEVRWMPSSNRRLRTFQVVECVKGATVL
ncbi:MAG: ExsB family protein [Atribacterota bacterium]|nr:ExsB family protein [Atribacterota bacterium]